MLKKILFSTIFLALLSCEETLFEPDISEEAVNILAPLDGVAIRSEITRFSWSAVSGATAYRLQVTTPNFENASQILVDTVIEQLSLEERLLSGQYQWRVRAENSGHQTAFTSALFTVE